MYNDAEPNLEFLKKQKQFYKNKKIAGSVKSILQVKTTSSEFPKK